MNTLNISIEKIKGVEFAEKVIVAEEVFEILEESYKNVKGGNLYKNSDELLLDTNDWELIWLNDEIVGCIIYKEKYGKKLVALGIRNIPNRKSVLDYLKWHLKVNLKYIWMEVSEAFEKWLFKNGFDKFIIEQSIIKKLLANKDISFCEDGVHYKRKIANMQKTKVAIGNPKEIA